MLRVLGSGLECWMEDILHCTTLCAQRAVIEVVTIVVSIYSGARILQQTEEYGTPYLLPRTDQEAGRQTWIAQTFFLPMETQLE